MTITIQLNTPEEWQVMEQLLLLVKKHRLDFSIKPASVEGRKKRLSRKTPGLAASLRGVVKLPEGFDHKVFLAEELVKKYGVNG